MPTNYAGDPDNYPANIPILSGSDAPTAANFNSAFGNGTIDRTAYLNKLVAISSIFNFGGAVDGRGQTTSGPIGTYDIAFYNSALNAAWLLLIETSSGLFQIVYGPGDGVAGFSNWTTTAITPSGGEAPAFAVVDSNGEAWLGGINGSTNALDSWRATLGASTWTANTSYAGTAVYEYRAVADSAGNLPSTVGSTTAGAWQLGRTTSGGFISALTGGSAVVETWAIASSGAATIAIPKTTTGGASVVGTAAISYLTIDGGIAWTPQSPVGFGAQERICDLVFDAVRQQWYMLSYDQGTPCINVWYSTVASSGAIWNKLATFGTLPGSALAVKPSSVATINGNFVFVDALTGNLFGSIDGIHYQTLRTGVPLGGGTLTNLKMAAGPNGIAAAECLTSHSSSPTTKARISGVVGVGNLFL